MAANAAAASPEQHRPMLAKAGTERVERRTLGRYFWSPRRAVASKITKHLNLLGNFWEWQPMVQHIARPGTVGSTYGLVNGIGNIVSALMPVLMGAAMTIHSTENLASGFWLIVGSQLLTLASGVWLLRRLTRECSPAI